MGRGKDKGERYRRRTGTAHKESGSTSYAPFHLDVLSFRLLLLLTIYHRTIGHFSHSIATATADNYLQERKEDSGREVPILT